MEAQKTEDSTRMWEILYERSMAYFNVSYEIAKLKTIQKFSDILSTILPHSIVFVLFSSFFLFINLGFAFWMGTILGNSFYGFFVVAGFYLIIGILIHFFFHEKIKSWISNFIIRRINK